MRFSGMLTARHFIESLEARAAQCDRDLAPLSSPFLGRIVDFARIEASVEDLAGDIATLPTVRAWIAAPATAPPAPGAQAPRCRELPSPGGFTSLVVGGLPALFAEFRAKSFALLWRGSRDGFLARQFHARCDGRANTLTLILDTAGNIFGGFTPVPWESRLWNGRFREDGNLFKGDTTLRSFLFTLRNPHNSQATRFGLRREAMYHAIECNAALGPCFCGIRVANHCNANFYSRAFLSSSWVNNTGLDENMIFTNLRVFTVKEIEVFEILD
jgi:hypothetical protein